MFDYDARVAFIVAHPDDETLGAGLLLQRLRHADIVYCATGRGRWPSNWWLNRAFPSRRSQLRIEEARRAIAVSGKNHSVQFLGYQDGWLADYLDDAYRSLADLLRVWQPQHVVTHAFDGGHEDHDACSFLAYQLSRAFNFQVWEMPLYYRQAGTHTLTMQAFTTSDPEDVTLRPASEAELEVKCAMLAAHQSQQAVIATFDPTMEKFRRQPLHDFDRAQLGIPRRRLFGISPSRVAQAFRSWKQPK